MRAMKRVVAPMGSRRTSPIVASVASIAETMASAMAVVSMQAARLARDCGGLSGEAARRSARADIVGRAGCGITVEVGRRTRGGADGHHGDVGFS
jgi:hypothetical protein